jgi:hypothetical protein
VSNLDVDQAEASGPRGPTHAGLRPNRTIFPHVTAIHAMIAEPRSIRAEFVLSAGAAACGADTFSSAAAIARSPSRQRFQWAASLANVARFCGRVADALINAASAACWRRASICPVILHPCVSQELFGSPACKMNSCNLDTASLILWQQQLSTEVFVPWSNSSSQNSGRPSRPTSGPRTMRISQLPAEASETDAAGLSAGMDESRT